MRYRLFSYAVITGVLIFFFGFSTTRVLNQIEESHMATAKLHLTTAIELIEDNTASFFENESIRVSDWSSDGFIRDTTEQIVNGRSGLDLVLAEYIKTKKMPLDQYVLAVEVVDEKGNLMSATVADIGHEGNTKLNHLEAFDMEEIAKLSFGKYAFSKPIFEEHEGVERQMMAHFASPLFSLNDISRRIGFLILHVRLDTFFDGISGENIKTTFGDPTLYLLGYDGAVYLPKSNVGISADRASIIVSLCGEGRIKDRGFIKEFSKTTEGEVTGAVVCPSTGWWIPYLAVNSSAIMEQIMKGREEIAFTLGIFFILTIILYGLLEYYISKKIDEIVRVLSEVSAGNLKSRVSSQSSFFGEIIRSINATIDSLEKTNAEQRLLEDRVISLDRVKNEFVSIAAHQIKTPVTSILTASEALTNESQVLPDKERELAHMIKTSAQKLNDFMSFLLSATRSETGNTKFHLTSFGLKELTQEVITTLHTDIDAKGVAVEIMMEPTELPLVYSDPEVLRQVIQNFLSNAIRYSHQGGKIEIKMTLRGMTIEYAVKDFGIGIPASVQNRVFGKFFRADNAKKEVPEGIGLGLSFTKSLVESWGGQVWFESKEGEGSTFYVTIPIVGTTESKIRILS